MIEHVLQHDLTLGFQANVSPLMLSLTLSQNRSHFSQLSAEGSLNSRFDTSLP